MVYEKIIMVVGPTAVGKTALAIKIAEKYTGELFSADSIQVYKGLDIISGKDKDKLGQIPLKLVDIVSFKTPFSVSDYIRSFENELQNQSSKLPIVVGGTGFYISALVNPIETKDVKPNLVLRQELNKLVTQELQGILKTLHVERFLEMNNSDRNNPRRLIRAIEIEKNSKNVHGGKGILDDYEILMIGLKCDKNVLDSKIDERVDERINQGALKEAEDLFEQYELLAPQIKQASGYRQLFEYLLRKCSFDDAVKNWKTAEHQNAKKQMTWFKKQKNIEWFDIEKSDFEAKIWQKLEEFLKS